MKRPKTLTAAFVRTVREPGVFGDGRGSRGLSLRVHWMRNGRLSKTWRQRVRVAGRLTTIGLGAYPEISLAEARKVAIENSRAAARGMDPRGDGIPSFERAAERVIALHGKTWKNPERIAGQWRQTLRDYAHPLIGMKRVNEITAADLMAILAPLATEKEATARNLRRRISTILKWAIAEGYRQDGDPTPAVLAALPRTKGRPKHYEAIPHREVGAALVKVRASAADPATRLVTEWTILTACRVSEARLAEWTEIDREAAIWTIPAERAKNSREFAVPLSTGALDILERARKLSDGSALVFPSRSGKAVARQQPTRLLRRLGVEGTIHGTAGAASATGPAKTAFAAKSRKPRSLTLCPDGRRLRPDGLPGGAARGHGGVVAVRGGRRWKSSREPHPRRAQGSLLKR